MLHFDDTGQVTSLQGRLWHTCPRMYLQRESTCKEQHRHPFLTHALLDAPCPLAPLYCGSFREKNKTVPSHKWSQKPETTNLRNHKERRKPSSYSLWWCLFAHPLRSTLWLAPKFSSYTSANTRSKKGPLGCNHEPVLSHDTALLLAKWGTGVGEMLLQVHLLSAAGSSLAVWWLLTAWPAPSPLVPLPLLGGMPIL